jgi:hypothetical protein
MSFDLFGGDLSPAPAVEPSWHGQAFDADNASIFEDQPYHPRLVPTTPGFDADLLAFVAQARHYGHTDPSLTPVAVTEARRRIFDELEVIRFANELLRGVRSDRPRMTPERWREATLKAREVHP